MVWKNLPYSIRGGIFLSIIGGILLFSYAILLPLSGSEGIRILNNFEEIPIFVTFALSALGVGIFVGWFVGLILGSLYGMIFYKNAWKENELSEKKATGKIFIIIGYIGILNVILSILGIFIFGDGVGTVVHAVIGGCSLIAAIILFPLGKFLKGKN